MQKKLSLAVICVAMFVIASCSSLPGLKSSFTVSKTVAGKTMTSELPYPTSINYYGFIKPGAKPDGMVDGRKKAYYLYVWVPAVIAEMSVRMISPTGEIASPSSGDIVSDTFKKASSAEKKMPTWFDTWLRVERMAAIMPGQIVAGSKRSLQKLGDNDDGDRTYDEKRHQKYNSYLTIKLPNPPKTASDISKIDPKKLLVRGLYRIAFTTYKRGEVKGSFVASVGVMFPPGLDGVSPIIHNDPKILQELAVKAEETLKKKLGDQYKKMTGQ
jgi:hypothetical protein